MKKVVLLFNNAGPYHWARIKALSKLVSLHVGIFSNKNKKVAYETSDFSGGLKARLFDDTNSESCHELFTWLNTLQPDALFILGWFSPFSLRALGWCLKNKVPSIVMSDTTEMDRPRNFLGEWVKSRIVNLFSAALVAGVSQEKYLIELGFRGGIQKGFYVVDNTYFFKQAQSARLKRSQTRKRLNLPEKYFLIVARLSEEKNISTAIQAFSNAINQGLGNQWHLVIAGHGPLLEKLKAQASNLKIENNIHFLGKCGYENLPAIYSLAAATILPSKIEPWGLVVNESMACGTPVIISNICGCAPELVMDKNTGTTFSPGDAESLSALMVKLASDNKLRKTWASNGLKIISKWGPNRFAQGAHKTMEKALLSIRKKPNLIDSVFLYLLAKR